MNISRPFIERPIATALLMVAMMLAGIVAYRMLAVSALPEVDYPTIQVTTMYPGASPEVMTSAVTAPLETQLGQMSGLSRGGKLGEQGVDHHVAIQSRGVPRRGRARGPGRDQRRE